MEGDSGGAKMNWDRVILILQRIKGRCTDKDEIAALDSAIRKLHQQMGTISYAMKRIDIFTEKLKRYEATGDTYQKNLAKANLNRWLDELARRQQALLKETTDV
jgi:hypothetical protein